jgi:hypothetical protein
MNKTFSVLYLLSVLFLLSFNNLTFADQSFKVGYADSMSKIRREKMYYSYIPVPEKIELDCAGEEAESFQLIVIPEQEPLKNVEVNIEPPASGKSKLDMRWHIVDYVKTIRPSKYNPEYVGMWPGPLLNASEFDLKKERVQPLWFTITAGNGVEPGVYKGFVKIKAESVERVIEISVRIRDFSLPRPGTFSAPFGLYAPMISSYYFGQGDYADFMTIEDYSLWCKFMTEYRLTPKNIAYEFIDRKLGNEVLDSKGANIARLLMHKDMSLPLTVNMAKLKKTVGKFADKYFPDYSYGLYRLPPYEEFLSENEDGVKVRDVAKENVENVVKPFIVHLEEWRNHDLPENVYVYGIDEPRDYHLDFLAKVYSRIKNEMPSAKIMQTIGTGDPSKLEGLVDIWCPITPHYVTHEKFYRKRSKEGDTIWLYVCCWPQKPWANFFTDEPAIDHRLLFWQAKQADATGLLYWGTTIYSGLEYNKGNNFPQTYIDYAEMPSMVGNEFQEEGYGLWNGDGLLIYPDVGLKPLSSIVLENIRDGIEDYEYISLLENTVKALESLDINKNHVYLCSKARKVAEVPLYITDGFTDYTMNHSLINDRRKEIGEMIEKLEKTVKTIKGRSL